MQPEKASEQRLSAEVPFCSPGCWHCCCGFIVTLRCVCPLPQRRNRYQQSFGEIIDLNPYSKKKGLFSLHIQDNASWNTWTESMINTSILARMTHNVNNSLHNWRHLNKIWDNTVQPGAGQPVCEGKSPFLRLPSSQHLWAISYSTGAHVRKSYVTGLR